MKNRFLFAALGGLILFTWQFLAFAFPAFHMSSMAYTPLQDEILAALEASGLESGMYVLGQPGPELMEDAAAMEAWQAAHEGSSHARINFRRNHSYSGMGMNLVRGFLVCTIIAWMLHALLRKVDGGLKQRLLTSMGVGVMGFLFIPYTNFIWFADPDIWAYLLDAIVPWALLGWLSSGLK